MAATAQKVAKDSAAPTSSISSLTPAPAPAGITGATELSARILKRLQAQCDTWNKKHPVGTAIVLQRDGGDNLSTKTRSSAEILSGHSAVIWLEGVSGCYLLDRVSPDLRAIA